jgi:hypothetical protein
MGNGVRLRRIGVRTILGVPEVFSGDLLEEKLILGSPNY